MKIFLSNIAHQQLNDLTFYLEVKWSIRVRDNFLAKFDRSVKSISLMPFAYPASDRMLGFASVLLRRKLPFSIGCILMRSKLYLF